MKKILLLLLALTVFSFAEGKQGIFELPARRTA